MGDTDFACRQCGTSFVADPSVARLDPYQSAFNSNTPQHRAPPPPPPFANAPAPFVDAAAPAPYAPAPGLPNGLSATAEASKALNWALLGFFCLGFFFGFKAVSHGRRALKLFATQPQMAGRQKAEFAILIGYVDIALWVVGILLGLAGRS
ncbi:MAG: hypothetical protein ABI183_12005 [Polyangiaceae bacterium]